MILAFDTYYFENKAKTVCLQFANWNDKIPVQIFSEIKEDVSEYESGAFYKRELPCILSLLNKINLDEVSMIVVDGFVFLDDEYKPGLGAHLFNSLEQRIPIIGVAKTNFAQINNIKREVYRGESRKPLYITSVGINIDEASTYVESMYGQYRIPDLLKQLDSMTKVK
ncbi:MAG: endonuclease V [Sporocytophaga sp.]|uniref:endonuclease V n=1 Tax=Sporocytophaga sp. TaxID=2231183 RepID=UPI001B1EBC76|nr:endonuclease V [Sporocytophaga sp.]MBO9700519.1 endonuclease V [Sporocytophaga sp.]